ncbi:MAG TPA: DNA repair protein RadA [Acidimicrobiales bacterium]|nr:DNA repair protein RadA [Acidimicrobiales bacterium]
MARAHSSFFCKECGTEAGQWVGKCGGCGEWNTLVQAPTPEAAPAGRRAKGGATAAQARPVTPQSLASFDLAAGAAQPTGIPELDRVLGGGLVKASATLLGGEPGVGKSTLLLQVMAAVAARGSNVLVVSAEEAGSQIRARAERLGLRLEDLQVLNSTSLDDACAAIEADRPELVVVDSIQTVHDPSSASVPGSVSQVTLCAQRLIAAAHGSGAALVLVGHVTKDGGLAGPRVLEHMVDTVLTFEGDQARQLRMLRAVKHRFGPTGELGLFEMGGAGLEGVTDPGSRFIGDRRDGITGSAVAATVDGHRTLVVELQALVVELTTPDATPRWATQGIDQRRLSLLTAVLSKRAGVTTGKCDVYAATTGGVRVNEPGADLALCLAIASSRGEIPLAPDLVAFGEVGLSGDVRSVGRAETRLREAARLGFKRALVPESEVCQVGGIKVVPVATIGDALQAAGLLGRRAAA